MKKIGVICLALLVCISSFALASGTERMNSTCKYNMVLIYNGTPIKIECIKENGDTYLPIRQVIEQLGGRVYWYGGGERQICFVLGKSKVYLDFQGQEYLLNGADLRLRDYAFYWQDGHCFILIDEIARILKKAL